MNIRPRCREWLPLSTQQLRLRNLQAIQAVNIDIKSQDDYSSCSSPSCQPPETLLYYTLHDHPENEAFYQSEKLPLRMHLPLKWAEIQCLSLLKSNANCVCIKIWIWTTKTEHDRENKVAKEKKKDKETNAIKDPISALTHEISRSYIIPQDKLLFTWGVYFSGLLPLSLNNNEVKCSSNSLIFQMNDEFFASPEHFSPENLRENLVINYERYSVSVPKSSDPTPDELTINSPHVSRSSSPTVGNWQRDLVRMSKVRYTQLQCIRSEVRPSYNLIKLLRLQLIQRQRIKTQRECVEMTADIQRLSLRCITKEQLLRKPRTSSMSSPSSSLTGSGSQYHSMGRALSLLLAEQQRIDPQELLRAQHLQQQVESLKSKQRLLQSAQSSFLQRITYLRQQLSAATVSRQQLQAWLTTRRRKLQEDKGEFAEQCVQQLERRHRMQSAVQNLQKRMSLLCIELKEIYPIARSRHGFHTICGVPFPSMEGYIYNSNNPNSVYISDNISPMALSASLGYVAHLVEMIAVVINRPLRNPIIHEGSQTRIKDTIKDIPSYTSREFPLYSRSSIPTKAVKYAVNLLNQNIAQLCYDLTGNHCDIRTTIINILKIFQVLAEIGKSKPDEIDTNYEKSIPQKQSTIGEMNSTTASIIDGSNFNRNSVKNGKDYASLSKSHSSVDMNHMQPPTVHPHHHLLHNNASSFPLTCENLRLSTHMSTQPIDMQQDRIDMLNNQQRISRSVGSYTDSEDECDFMVCSVKGGFSNSDSNLTLQSGGHM